MKNENEKLKNWISRNFLKSNKLHLKCAYGLKHIVSRNTGIYLTLQEFQDIMQELGFRRSRSGKYYLTFTGDKAKNTGVRKNVQDAISRSVFNANGFVVVDDVLLGFVGYMTLQSFINDYFGDDARLITGNTFLWDSKTQRLI